MTGSRVNVGWFTFDAGERSKSRYLFVGASLSLC